ncbi:MAG: peptide/nickel transport system permease protein [Solirubrobacteraceae bacterium]|jgi:peptide/nickel transport system permease protein|nr:peptide/nickel transport system permease protein [Solirubrobacteraceae bacterium]
MGLAPLPRLAPLAVLIVPAAALLAPLVAPHAEDEVVGAPFATASSNALLGTDELGRDVLSRFLHGGDELIMIAALAAVAGTAVGVLVGLGAAVARPWIGRALERTSEVLLVIPALLVLILLGTRSPDAGPLAVAALLAILAVPWVARVMAAAAHGALSTGYVEHAVATGESTWRIVTRELAPALRGTVLATLGLRFVEAIYLVAGAAFLGIGPQPPQADWAVMVRENVPGLLLNPLGALAPCAAIALTGIAVGLACDRRTSRPAHA